MPTSMEVPLKPRIATPVTPRNTTATRRPDSNRESKRKMNAVRTVMLVNLHAVTNSFLSILGAHNSRRNVFRCQIEAFATAD